MISVWPYGAVRMEAIKSFDYFQLISHEKYVIFIEWMLGLEASMLKTK